MKNKLIFLFIGSVFVGLLLLGFFLFSPTVAMRRHPVDEFLTEFEGFQNYSIDVVYNIDKDDRHSTTEQQMLVSEVSQTLFRDFGENDDSFRFVERIGDQWVGYRDAEYGYLNPELIDVEDDEAFLEDFVKERPDQLIASLPWDRAKIVSFTGLRFELTFSEFLSSPLFAMAIAMEGIDETTEMPLAFRAVVDLKVDKKDGHLIVYANATDVKGRHYFPCLPIPGYINSDCNHTVGPTDVFSEWHFRVDPDMEPIEPETNGYKFLPPGDPAVIRANSEVDVQYSIPFFLNRVSYQRFWLEEGRVEISIIGTFYLSLLMDELGTTIPQQDGVFEISSSGLYTFAFQSLNPVRFTFHQVD